MSLYLRPIGFGVVVTLLMVLMFTSLTLGISIALQRTETCLSHELLEGSRAVLRVHYNPHGKRTSQSLNDESLSDSFLRITISAKAYNEVKTYEVKSSNKAFIIRLDSLDHDDESFTGVVPADLFRICFHAIVDSDVQWQAEWGPTATVDIVATGVKSESKVLLGPHEVGNKPSTGNEKEIADLEREKKKAVHGVEKCGTDECAWPTAQEVLERKKLEELSGHLINVERLLKEVRAEGEYLSRRNEESQSTANSTFTRVWVMSFVTLLALVITGAMMNAAVRREVLKKKRV